MKRVVLCGFKGCGKSTVGTYLVEQHGFAGFSFADAVKDCLSSIFCWDREMLEGLTLDSRVWREQVDPWWAEKLNIPQFTPRWAMQNFGTEIMRTHFHPEVWIKNVERRIHNVGETPVVIFDARFPNEIAMVKRLGGVSAWVKRADDPEWFNTAFLALRRDSELHRIKMHHHYKVHESEWAWVDHRFDHIINNDSTIEELHKKAKELLL